MAENLRLDYAVECENCGAVQDIPTGFSEAKARTTLREQGWRLVDDGNHCPTCVKGNDNDDDT